MPYFPVRTNPAGSGHLSPVILVILFKHATDPVLLVMILANRVNVFGRRILFVHLEGPKFGSERPPGHGHPEPQDRIRK